MARPAAPRPLRVALAHDWLVGLRGGERVLDRIAAVVGEHHTVTRIYTMFDARRPLTPALDRLPRITPWLARPPAALRLRRWMLPVYPALVGSLTRTLARDHARERIDLLISTSSSAIKGLRPPRGVPHLCYCHTPARYLWSQQGAYASESRLRAAGLAFFGPGLRSWDKATAANVSMFLANSTHTAREIRRCFDRDSTILFPPIDVEGFALASGPAPARTGRWLVVSALEPYKRVDLAIEAARLAGAPLTIVGEGSQAAALRALAAGARNIEFAGRVTHERLRELIHTSRLMLFPQVEDFGMSGVEALAGGLPVVARHAGGALDFVVQGVTGSFFEDATPESLCAAARECPPPGPACADAARAFAVDRFDAGLREAITRCVATAQAP